MLVALCLVTVLAVAVVGFFAVSQRTMELSNRSFCYTSSVLLAEIGMEEALQALNTSGYSWATSGWTTATVSGVPTATRTLTGFYTNNGLQGTVNITVQYYTALAPYTQPPVITSVGTSQMPDGITINKQLMAYAKPAALFGSAVGAYSSCSFTIAYTYPIKSYESHVSLDPNNSAQTRKDEAIVSAPTVSGNAATISGYVATTGSGPAWTSGGTVTRANSSRSPDPLCISTNASQINLAILSDNNLPGTYAGIADPVLNPTMGTVGATVTSRYVTTNNLSLSSTQTITVNGPVIIVVDGNFSITGSAKIVIQSGGSLQIVVGGEIKIQGNGIDNTATKLPGNLAIFGRSSNSYSDINDYTAQLQTSSPFYGVIYVPNGSLQLYGTTTVYGALVANVIDEGYGAANLRYDLDLRKTTFSALTTPFSISQWLSK